jgi:hypothetical protein
MRFKRPTNSNKLTKEQKLSLLKEYVSHYEREAAADQNILKQGVPREAFSDLLNQIGQLLLRQSKIMSTELGAVSDFLKTTPLPPRMEELLPLEFRVYCLALNALKQWVGAEQAATDKFLLGGTAREICRAAAAKCIVTGESLQSNIELHHPVRDGRPPIPLSKRGHALIEHQTKLTSNDPVEASLIELKQRGNRSWAMLRRGCLDLLGTPEPVTSPSTAASARTFARKATKTSNMSCSELLSWLDSHDR